MYQEAFTKLELDSVATILDEVNPHIDGTRFDPVETTILTQDISFYPEYRFLDVADYAAVPAMRRYVIYKPGDFTILDMTNAPIYALNQKLPIRLTAENIADYVRFFFRYVRGKNGRFIIVEGIDDFQWRDDPPPTARKAIGEMLTPISMIKMDGANFMLKACMIFKDSLFKTSVKVEPNGFVTLSDEELLIEDLPVMDDTFGQ